MLLVLAAPSVHNKYYKSKFQNIVDFQIRYAKLIIGNDNVVVIVDEDTKQYYDKDLPEDVLITGDVEDIWMRDFTTINPLHPIQFRYTSTGTNTKADSKLIQKSFNSFISNYGITYRKTPYLLDGGNIVDNYKGKAITTRRFMEDNGLKYNQAKQKLKSLIDLNEVAIIEPDDQVLAHSDGMVMWLDDNTLLVNDYSNDATFEAKVMNELQASLSNTNFITVPVKFDNRKFRGFDSACGINLNSVLTYNNVYVPVFNMSQKENQALNIIKQNTNKKIIQVNAKDVCIMGGSVRCLTWQVIGENARKIILAARDY